MSPKKEHANRRYSEKDFQQFFPFGKQIFHLFFTDPIKTRHEYTRRIRGTDPSSKKFRYF